MYIMKEKERHLKMKKSKHESFRRQQHYEVEESMELLPFLLTIIRGKGRNAVKAILTRGQVMVDGKTVTKHNFPLEKGHRVSILSNEVSKKIAALEGIAILYEDQDLIVVSKEPGLLTMSDGKEPNTAYRQVMNYVKQTNPQERIFIVHRLDRETSGVLLFAKSEKMKNALQNDWSARVKERLYVAVVEGSVMREEGTIQSWLKESAAMKMYSSPKEQDGQLAITHYRTIAKGTSYSLLEVRLETGRKNQIRVHLSDIGHPIVGDRKYGAATNPLKRLGLHAKGLTVEHPFTNKQMQFISPVPSRFQQIIKK